MSFVASLLLLLVPALAPEGDAIPLPEPRGLDMSLREALAKRHSTRSFDASRNLSREQLATLLWSAVGITRPDSEHPQGGKRTSPSAYGSASIDVYVTSREGTFLYAPVGHALVPRSSADLREKLGGADWARSAPSLLLLVANLERYPERVSAEDRRDYSYADAAAAGENLYLAATALGLGTVLTVSSAPEAEGTLGLGEGQKVIFVFPVGYER